MEVITDVDTMLPYLKSTDIYKNNINKASKSTQKVIDFLYNIWGEMKVKYACNSL